MAARQGGIPIESVADQIQRLSLEAAKALLLRLAQDPAIGEKMRPWLSAKTPISPVPAADVRRQVRRAFRSVREVGADEALWYVKEAVDGLEPLRAQAEELLAQDQARAAFEMLMVLVDAYLEPWQELEEEEDGEGSRFLSEVAFVLIQAALLVELDAEERALWQAKASEWDDIVRDYGVGEMAAVSRALATGTADPEAPRDEALSPAERQLALGWLAIVFRQDDHQRYLEYSDRAGLRAEHALYLVHLGRVEEGIAYAQRHLDNPDDMAAVVTQLWAVGSGAPAVALGMWALAQDLARYRPLAQLVAELADGLGDRDAAYQSHQAAWTVDPSAARYARIKTLAGSDWPTIAEHIWAELGEKGILQVAVTIFLSEGRIQDAMALCDRRSWSQAEVWGEVGRAAVEVSPDWVIDRLGSQALTLVEAGKSSHYQQAAGWLAIVRDAYQAKGEAAAWQNLKSELLTRHRRKHALVPLLNGL
ncbi:MAG: hypothetical protein M0Z53_09045 [Thermaerobacter sp.]|nr:hypothetical protein [Thermaerobacter sp.]